MSEEALKNLAHQAGIAPTWRDAFGQMHDVSPDSLKAVLRALDFAADSENDIAESMQRLCAPPSFLPPLVTALQGEAVALPVPPQNYRLTLEDGRVFEGAAQERYGASAIPAILEPGYHYLQFGDAETLVAVAPRQCLSVQDVTGRSKVWGLAVQLYSLRRADDGGLGDFAALAQLAPHAARHGAQAIAISPVHAQFSADPDRFSPYSPSSRTALNVLHGAVDVGNPALESSHFVDWPRAARWRMQQLHRMYAAQRNNAAQAAEIAAFLLSQGEKLRTHAIFEALHAYFFNAGTGPWHWRDWPPAFRTPHGPEIDNFVRDHADEISFHIWLQFHADRGLASAQQACRESGMGIGLISDLAVGTDSGGSQCWARQQEALLGLSIGAPPDPLGPAGQNWGLTAFSPRGMVARGFTAYREMLQTALAHAGGIRIDHALGLNRLWVIPDGAQGSDGAYLNYPERDLFNLIALESIRHNAVVLAEDLGTVPEGFRNRLADAGMNGLRVLWFERDESGYFTNPRDWPGNAVAMTSTHDLATLAGWWQGRDLAWRAELGYLADSQAAQDERARDRARLWQAMGQTGAAQGDEPAWHQTAQFATTACQHIGASGCALVMLPLEDALGVVEQPNLPGTVQEHPNWQRRVEAEASALLDAPEVAARLAALEAARSA